MFSVGLDASLNTPTPLGTDPINIIRNAFLLNNIIPITSGEYVSNPKTYKYDEREIREILFGSLLGDGKLEMALRSKNARFGFIQSIKAKEYFVSLYSILSHLCSSNFREYSYYDKRTDKTYTSLNFWTKALPPIPSLG